MEKLSNSHKFRFGVTTTAVKELSIYTHANLKTVRKDKQRDRVSLSTQFFRSLNGIDSPNKAAVCRQHIWLQLFT